MALPIDLNPHWLASSAGYEIERSLRFNSADSAYLNRTPGSASNRRTWTYSFWVKRAKLSRQMFLGVYTSSSDVAVIEIESDQIYWYDYLTSSYRYELRTTQVLRDPSAWYHIMCVLDTTQATSSNRNKIYINGSLVTALTTATYPTQNLDGKFNTAVQHSIGTEGSNLRLFLDAYQTEINFIDGQALTPSSFGLNDPETGVWSPKQYTGTYGTNGFYLNFSDNSGTTSTTLGADSSGNGNNWTANNFSVTAGAGNDSLVDSPTSYGTDTGVGGEVRGNYCTMNVLDKYSGITMSEGNLKVQLYSLANGAGGFRGTLGVSSGKWYWEVLVGANQAARPFGHIGIDTLNTAISSINTVGTGTLATSYVYYQNNGNKINNNTSTAYGASYTTNDVIGVELDLDAGILTFYKNGVSQGQAFSGISGTFAPSGSLYSDTVDGSYIADMQYNFGQRAFAYTAPSGFKALCTQNLPTPTIKQGDDYFNAVLYTGNGTAISNNTVGFQPDWTWIKGRSGATNHQHFDSIRGVTNVLVSNSAEAETTSANTLTSFDSSGFTVGSNTALNTSAATYVAWNWNAASSNTTDNSGTITSTRRTNTTAGFSIVTYTGTGANTTVGHGLGVAPSMVIVKSRTSSRDWPVYHVSPGNTQYAILNGDGAFSTASTFWNNTSPTSTVFSIGTALAVNASENYVAYCFAAVPGYSAFGSYTGNGSTDGPFTYLGFRPRYVMIKGSSFVSNWFVIDTSRSSYNVSLDALRPNLNGAEVNSPTTTYSIDILSNGFKLRTSAADSNTNAATFIYACFAENPFKYSLAR